MANYGIKIAKEGKSITSTTPADYHFWSKYAAKSIKYQGSLQVTTNTGTDPSFATSSYLHNFGYIPQFMVFVGDTYSDNYYVNCNWNSGGAYGKEGEIWEETLQAYATSTGIYVKALLTHGFPQSGTSEGIARTYTFDILLFMEEVETS